MAELMAGKEWYWGGRPVGLVVSTCITLAIPFLVYSFLSWSRSKKLNLPPGPPRWPIIGNMTALMDKSKPLHHIVDDLAKVHGPIMMLKVGVQHLVFVTDPEIALEVLKVKDHLLAFRPLGLPAAKYMTYGYSSISLSAQGDRHSFLRKLLATELFTTKKLQAFRALRRAEQDNIVRESYKASIRNESVNVHHQVNKMSLNIIANLSVSSELHGPGTKIQWTTLIPILTENFEAATTLAETIHPSLQWVDHLMGTRRHLKQLFKTYDEALQAILDEHKKVLGALNPKELAEYEPRDFMDIVLLQRNGEFSKLITDTVAKAVTVDMIIAGSETVVTAIDWAMSELLINPHVMKRAQEEVDSVIGKERFVTEGDVENMPYLDAVVKEAFRVHPPVPWLLPHSNRVDCKIAGFDIPRNSFININIYGISRSESLWSDPLKFDPERFLSGPNSSVNYKGAYPQLMPFGRGRRSCPGMGFANIILYTVLARLIHSFDWSLPAGQTVDAKWMAERHGLVASRMSDIVAIPKPRLAAHLYESL